MVMKQEDIGNFMTSVMDAGEYAENVVREILPKGYVINVEGYQTSVRKKGIDADETIHYWISVSPQPKPHSKGEREFQFIVTTKNGKVQWSKTKLVDKKIVEQRELKREVKRQLEKIMKKD